MIELVLAFDCAVFAFCARYVWRRWRQDRP